MTEALSFKLVGLSFDVCHGERLSVSKEYVVVTLEVFWQSIFKGDDEPFFATPYVDVGGNPVPFLRPNWYLSLLNLDELRV